MGPEVRSSVRIDLAGNLKEGMDASIKSITNAEQAARKLNDTLKQTPASPGGPGSPNAPTGPGGVPVYDKRILQAEMAARMSSVELERYLATEAAKTKAEQHKRETAARLSQQQQARQTLAMQGLALSGMGGVAGGYGQGLAIGSALDSAGYVGLARAAGPVGLAVGASAAVLSQQRNYEPSNRNAVYADPYMDDRTRNSNWWRSMPLGETISDTYRAFSGRTAGMERNREQDEFLGNRIGNEEKGRRLLFDVDRRQSAARDESVVAKTRRFDEAKMFDQRTVEGERLERESRELEPARKQVILAEREMVKAKNEYFHYEVKRVKLMREREDVGIDIEAQKKLANMTDDPVALQSAFLKMQRFIKKRTGINAELSETVEKEHEAKLRIATAQRNVTLASKAEVGRGELAQLDRRVQESASAATRLGMMGPGGRAQSKAAFEAVKQIGIENAPAELIADASAYAPEDIRKMAERAGSGEMFRQAKADAPDSYRDIPDEIRNERSKKRAEIQKAEQGADVDFGEAVATASKSLSSLVHFLTSTWPDSIQEIENKLRMSRLAP